MQQLYSIAQDRELTFKEAKQAYFNTIHDSFRLYLLNLYCIMKVCSAAAEDFKIRSAKHIKSADDKHFTDKIYSNHLVTSLVSNKKLQDKFKEEKCVDGLEEDLFRRIYKEFCKEESYQKYLTSESTDEDHVEILLELYRFCRKNEVFNEIMDDRFTGWMDDKSLVIGALKKTLKILPRSGPIYEEHIPDDDTVINFGQFLLETTYREDKDLENLINPVLENWDSERVALIDMILIKMGVVEMSHFKTIPAKVTLNEYVELSKTYSTDKSKEFVNGVLDKLLKQLEAEGKIVKEGRGLSQ
ncbi:MAG: transcription antitermination factor NusB [Saprospiraceae bacterium]